MARHPPGLSLIAADPDTGFGVLDLPGGYKNGNAYVMLSACHGRAIVAGETSRQIGTTLLDQLEMHDLAAQRRQLATAHVKYIILHALRDGQFGWRKADGTPEAYLAAYPLVWRGGGITILRVYTIARAKAGTEGL